MKVFTSLVAAVTIAALLGGCGGGSGVRFSDLFDDSAAAEGTGVQGYALVRAVVILATHDATAQQRQVAEQNGKRAVAQLKARLAAEPDAPRPSLKPRRKKPLAAAAKSKAAPTAGKPAQKVASSAATPEPVTVEEPAATPRPKAQKKLPRIIAIATEKNESTDKKAAKAIMLFDTQSQEIIGNKVYDIEREPRKGDEVRFETYSTSYIGASL